MSRKNFQIFSSLCESCNYDALIVILGLQWISVEFLASYLVVSPILTLATEQIIATQVFSTELMFVIPNFVADLIYSWWIFRPIQWLDKNLSIIGASCLMRILRWKTLSLQYCLRIT